LRIKRVIASIIYLLDRLFPQHRIGGRGSEEEYSNWEYEVGKELVKAYPEFLGNLSGKRVLDAGCGPGGKTAAYAEQSNSVFGIDISVNNIKQAVSFASGFSEVEPPVFLVASADRLPFSDESFDIIIANDSMEHFENPGEALGELSRAVKRGGLMVLFFTPWSSPLGSHLYDYIRTPWCHLLYPEWLIEELLTVILERSGDTQADETAARLMEEYRSELNRITISQYRDILKGYPELEVVHEELKPAKYRFLAPLTGLPLVGRFLTNTVVSVLRKR